MHFNPTLLFLCAILLSVLVKAVSGLPLITDREEVGVKLSCFSICVGLV